MIPPNSARKGGSPAEADLPSILAIKDVVQDFAGPAQSFLRRSSLRAVDKVSFEIGEGEAFGLVGESGSGKTTIGRMVVRLQRPTSGQITFRGRDILPLAGRQLTKYRRDVQMIFQNPLASLNPRRRVRDQ